MQKKEGVIVKLYISTGDPQNPRKEVTGIEVDSQGVIGDKFYAKDPNRTILLSSIKSYQMAKENGIELEVGLLGENIYIDIDPYALLPGDEIEIGSVRFVVTQNCTLCKGLSQIDSRLPKLLKEDRGIFIRALNDGKLSVGDRVRLKEKR